MNEHLYMAHKILPHKNCMFTAPDAHSVYHAKATPTNAQTHKNIPWVTENEKNIIIRTQWPYNMGEKEKKTNHAGTRALTHRQTDIHTHTHTHTRTRTHTHTHTHTITAKFKL